MKSDAVNEVLPPRPLSEKEVEKLLHAVPATAGTSITLDRSEEHIIIIMLIDGQIEGVAFDRDREKWEVEVLAKNASQDDFMQYVTESMGRIAEYFGARLTIE